MSYICIMPFVSATTSRNCFEVEKPVFGSYMWLSVVAHMNFQLEKHNLWEIGVCTPVKRIQNLSSSYFPTLNYCMVMSSMISSFHFSWKTKLEAFRLFLCTLPDYWGESGRQFIGVANSLWCFSSSTHCISSIQRKVLVTILRLQRLYILCNLIPFIAKKI